MIAKTWSLRLVASAALIAIIAGCGGGSAGPKPASTTPGPAGSEQQSTEGRTSSVASTGAAGELASVAQNFARVKSFRATLSISGGGSGGQQGTMEVITPDKLHLRVDGGPGGGIELISIGSASYVKIDGKWSKQSGSGGGALFDPKELNSQMLSTDGAKNVVKGGTATVSGRQCQLYTSKNDSSTQEICVADALPLRIVEDSGETKTTITLTDYNANLEIKAPI